MAEIQRARIKSLYGDLKGLLEQLVPLQKIKATKSVRFLVDASQVESFNAVVRQLSRESDTDYSLYLVPEGERLPHNDYNGSPVVTRVGRLVRRLEEEHGFGEQQKQAPFMVIYNKNQNEVTLQVNYTLEQLITAASTQDEKKELSQLKDELEEPEKNWENIKKILGWILNFSKDLFLKIIPLVLERYNK